MHKTNLARFRAYFRRTLVLMGGFSLIINLLLLVMPLYMLQVYDRILPSRSLDTLLFLSIIAVGALVVLGMLEAVRSVIASRLGARLDVALSRDVLRYSVEHADRTDPDVEPMRRLLTIRQFITSRMLFALMDFPFAPLFIAVLYLVHPTLFWLTLGGAAALFVLAMLNQWITRGAANRAAGHQEAAMSVARSLARNADTLNAMGFVSEGIRVWGKQNAQTLVDQGKVDMRNAVLTGL